MTSGELASACELGRQAMLQTRSWVGEMDEVGDAKAAGLTAERERDRPGKGVAAASFSRRQRASLELCDTHS